MRQIAGFRGFSIMWFGQSVSLIGTAMSRFALTIWAYQITGSATALALVAFFSFAPTILFSPIAGALVDRWNRKTIMIITDLAAGMATIGLLILFTTGQLEIWHLYVAGAFASTFEAFQFPAFSAAITMMLEKKNYGRASGMRSMAESGSTIIAPVIATIVLVAIGIEGVLLLDVISFVVGISTLFFVHIPEPERSDVGEKAQGSLWQESLFGFRYIKARPPLLGIQFIFFLTNLFSMVAFTLLPIMILARTGNDEVSLASVQTMLGVGGLVGGMIMTAWGGSRRKVHGVFTGMFLSAVFGQIVMGFGQSVLAWSVGAFMLMFFVPFINGSNQAIWQSKVPPDLQGRVFAVRRLIAQITAPLGMLMVGPLADGLFEPAMMEGGALVGIFGAWVGVGAGAGMGLMFVLTGILSALGGLCGYLFPFIRNIEDILPDYDDKAKQKSLG
jgi:MFS transporter, DHA3 family, macrolide efflux protein